MTDDIILCVRLCARQPEKMLHEKIFPAGSVCHVLGFVVV